MILGSYEKCKLYIESHTPCEQSNKNRNNFPSITISRESGAGARPVSKILIKILEERTQPDNIHWTYFNHALIEKILEDHNLPKQISAYMVEDKYRHLTAAVNEMLGLHPSHWTILHHTTETILQLARMGKAIIVGRGGNIITSSLEKVYHVRLVAPMENKIEYIMNYYNISREQAKLRIKKSDSARRKYLKSNFDKEIENPEMYHIIVNTGLLSYTEAAEVIANGIMKKFPKFYLSNPKEKKQALSYEYN